MLALATLLAVTLLACRSEANATPAMHQADEPESASAPTAETEPDRPEHFWTREELLKIDLLLGQHVRDAYDVTIYGRTTEEVSSNLCFRWSEFEYDETRMREFSAWALDHVGKAIHDLWNDFSDIMEHTIRIFYKVLEKQRPTRNAELERALLALFCANRYS